MYGITLTHAERSAITWVGNRYANGTQLRRLLWLECEQMLAPGQQEAEWESSAPITFAIPEHVAWLIQSNYIREGECWPCFGGSLLYKLNVLLNSIV